MNKVNKIIEKFNFKKIFAVYLIFAVLAGILCGGAVGYIYKDKLRFAFEYERLSARLRNNALDMESVKSELDELSQSSPDIVDILILDNENNVLYSAKNTNLAWGDKFEVKRNNGGGNFLVSDDNSNAVFHLVKKDEFMLSSLLSGDFAKIYDEYEDDNFYFYNFENKKIYLLSFIREGSDKIYIIGDMTPVKYGEISVKSAAAAAMLLFMIYWIIIALWVYQNALRSRLSAPLWGIIVLFTNIAGVFVYMVYKRMNNTCAYCGAVMPRENMYCGNCGKKMVQSCRECGGSVRNEDRYCGKCGHEIEKAE